MEQGLPTPQYFKRDAKTIVDMLFDGKLFRDGVSRDDMNHLEELIDYIMSSRFESYAKMNKLIEGIETRKREKQI